MEGGEREDAREPRESELKIRYKLRGGGGGPVRDQ